MNNNKFIFTADLHLKNYNDKKITKDGISYKLHEILNVFESICNYAINNNIPQIIIGGDINDTKNIIHAPPFLYFSRILQKYKNINFLLLKGNHDITNDIKNDSGMNLLEADNVKVINKTTIIDNILFVPFNKQMINEIRNSNPMDILITHIGLSDTRLSSGISLKNGINIKEFNKFKLCLAGHYHKPQMIENFYYAGSLIQLNANESGDRKRFLVIDKNTLEVNSIETKGYRKYITIEINKKIKNKKVFDNLLKLSEKLKSKDYFVKIINENKLFNDLYLKNNETNENVINYVRDKKNTDILISSKLDEQMIKYLEIKGIQDKEKYIKTGIEIINQGIENKIIN